jgi:transposase
VRVPSYRGVRDIRGSRGSWGSKQQKYDAEFREAAVRIVIETGKPIPEVAEDLGVQGVSVTPCKSRGFT